jgi:hypothetical protein
VTVNRKVLAVCSLAVLVAAGCKRGDTASKVNPAEKSGQDVVSQSQSKAVEAEQSNSAAGGTPAAPVAQPPQ